MKKAVFPGSFDPITLGHCEIIEKACEIFDEVIVAVGNNSDKNYKFSLDQRLKFISNEFKNNPTCLECHYRNVGHEYGNLTEGYRLAILLLPQ
mgnify:CR=1 FL=1